MGYQELKSFITQTMRMSHVYQPVVIRELLLSKGQASSRDIASKLAAMDPTQIEYFEQILNRYPKTTLRSHGIADLNRGEWHLNDASGFNPEQIKELVELCDEKISDYLDETQARAFAHRTRGYGAVPGHMRFEVLRRAKHRCELCGISADLKALEVDHIVPKSRGGQDELANFQALCYTCNAQKGNKDSTDFRNLDAMYDHRDATCPFCKAQTDGERKILDGNNLAFTLADAHPVTFGHVLIIPKRHEPSYFELTHAEQTAIGQLVDSMQARLRLEDASILGFNVGINIGEVAGQTIEHAHVHLIPRRTADTDNPRGGVRNLLGPTAY